MKKTLFALTLSALLALQAHAYKIGGPDGIPDAGAIINGTPADGVNLPTAVDAVWNISYTYVPGKITYWTKVEGNYDLNLGIASLDATKNEAGTLSVYTTHSDWTTLRGFGLVSNTGPYQVHIDDTGLEDYNPQHMSVFIGRPRHPREGSMHAFPCIQYHINYYNYPATTDPDAKSATGMDSYNGTTVYTDRYGNEHETLMAETHYSNKAIAANLWTYNNAASGAKLTFGFTLGAAIDENGNITGMRVTIPETFTTPDYTLDGSAIKPDYVYGDGAAMAETDLENGTPVTLELDAWLESPETVDAENSVDLPNMGYGFNLTNLRSWGPSTIDSNVNERQTYGIDPDAVTYIIITKDLPVPEPTTATLSLLALAGLAARRRRK